MGCRGRGRFSSRDYVGTALTLQLCTGFLLTLVTMIPLMASVVGWQWAFLLVPGPTLGTLAMFKLAQESRSA